jgi:hypothetical protein
MRASPPGPKRLVRELTVLEMAVDLFHASTIHRRPDYKPLPRPSPFPASLAPSERQRGDGGGRGICGPDATGITEGAGAPRSGLTSASGSIPKGRITFSAESGCQSWTESAPGVARAHSIFLRFASAFASRPPAWRVIA